MYVTQIVQMIVFKIVQAHGVVIWLTMNVEFVVEIIVHVQIVQVLQMVMLI